jgi:mediator of RNA polymerase II transcription subunit 12, fungi type
MVTHRSCFILPKSWDSYSSTLESNIPKDDSVLLAAFHDISKRNKRLLARQRLGFASSQASPKRQLIKILDSVHGNFDLNLVSTLCVSAVEEPASRLVILLQWATSRYRVGSSRVYVAVRLFRKWHRDGVDTDGSILSFLAAVGEGSSITAINKSQLYLLISELARSKHFSCARYLQWLIARGSLRRYDSLDTEDPCHTRLLAELPILNLPPHVRNLRRQLLRRAGFSVEEEAMATTAAKDTISALIPDLFGDSVSLASKDEHKITQLQRLSRTVKSGIGLWLREHVASHLVQGAPLGPKNWRDLTHTEVGISALTPSQFMLIRQVLEAIDDYSILADITKIASSSDNSIVLASIADTIHYNSETFSAIGAAKHCFGLLLERHNALKPRRPAEKFLIVSMIELSTKLAEQDSTTLQLKGDLLSCDPQTAVAACSPVSEHMIDTLPSLDGDFNEEFEKLLSSGNSMDIQALTRLFETVVARMMSGWGDVDQQPQSFALLLTRLRVFDPSSFDELMKGWVTRVLVMTSRLPLREALAPLISAGCLTLRDAVACSRDLVLDKNIKEEPSKITDISIETLQLLNYDCAVEPSPADYVSTSHIDYLSVLLTFLGVLSISTGATTVPDRVSHRSSIGCATSHRASHHEWCKSST